MCAPINHMDVVGHDYVGPIDIRKMRRNDR